MISSKKTPPPLGHECDRNCRPRVPPGTHRQRKGAKTSPKGVARHSQATERGINVAQGCRPALTGNRKSLKRCPKGVARHSQATKRGENVAQGCRPALTGNEKGQKRCPRAQGSTLRRQIGARTSPKGPVRHSEATNMKEFVASGCRASHAALISLNIFCQAPIAKSA